MRQATQPSYSNELEQEEDACSQEFTPEILDEFGDH